MENFGKSTPDENLFEDYSKNIFSVVTKHMDAFDTTLREISVKFSTHTIKFYTKGIFIENIIDSHSQFSFREILKLSTDNEIDPNTKERLSSLIKEGTHDQELLIDLISAVNNKIFILKLYESLAIEALLRFYSEIKLVKEVTVEKNVPYLDYPLIHKTAIEAEEIINAYENIQYKIEENLHIQNKEYSQIQIFKGENFNSFNTENILQKFLTFYAHSHSNLLIVKFSTSGYLWIETLKELHKLIELKVIELKRKEEVLEAFSSSSDEEKDLKTFSMLLSEGQQDKSFDSTSGLNRNNDLESQLIDIMRMMNELKERYRNDSKFLESTQNGETSMGEEELALLKNSVNLLSSKIYELEKNRQVINDEREEILLKVIETLEEDPQTQKILERKLIAIKSVNNIFYSKEEELKAELSRKAEQQPIVEEKVIEEMFTLDLPEIEEEFFVEPEKIQPVISISNLLDRNDFFSPIEITDAFIEEILRNFTEETIIQYSDNTINVEPIKNIEQKQELDSSLLTTYFELSKKLGINPSLS